MDFVNTFLSFDKLIGTAGNVGAMKVSELASAVEKSCKAGEFASAQATVAVLRRTADMASEGLGRLRASPGSGEREGNEETWETPPCR